MLPNPWFTRMTPVRELDVVIWALSSLAVGALLATYVRPRSRPTQERRAASVLGTDDRARPGGSSLLGGLFSVFAIGCPVCNKLVVLVLGLSGAATYFGPLQPLLGVIAVLLPLWALRLRLRSLGGVCATHPAEPVVGG